MEVLPLMLLSCHHLGHSKGFGPKVRHETEDNRVSPGGGPFDPNQPHTW